MQDRAPTYPGRVQLTPVPGQANTFDMVRADEPTQEGTPLNKATLLSDGTCTALGVPTTSVPDDALAKLAVGAGKYGYYLTVKFADGSPAVGITITGLTNAAGNACVTNSSGEVLGVSTSASASISITGYLDIATYSATLTSTRVITPVAITLTDAASIGTISTSKTVKFARDVKVDLHLIGGGYNGASPNSSYIDLNGGASGKAYYVSNVSFNKNTAYSATVGAANGGNSTFGGHSSASGTSSPGGDGGAMNGSGGGASPISSSLIVGGSGGSGGQTWMGTLDPGVGANGGGDGGSKYGGNGGNGTQPGAGGGGGGLYSPGTNNKYGSGGAGAAGAIYYKWRLAA